MIWAQTARNGRAQDIGAPPDRMEAVHRPVATPPRAPVTPRASKAASPAPKRPTSARKKAAPDSPAPKAKLASTSGSTVNSGKGPATPRSKKKATKVVKKVKKVSHTLDGELAVQEDDDELQPTGAAEGDGDAEPPETPSAAGAAAREDDDLSPDAAAFLAEALASFRAPGSVSHRLASSPAPSPSAGSASGSAPVYRELYGVNEESSTEEAAQLSTRDSPRLMLCRAAPAARSARGERHPPRPPLPPPPPPLDITAAPPPEASSPPPPPGKAGDTPNLLSAALSEINSGLASHRLRHVANAHDRSTPLIEAGTTVKRSLAPQLFAELQSVVGGSDSDGSGLSKALESHRLRHVETANDRSAPLIEQGLKIRPSAHASLVDEIKTKKGFIDSFIHRRARQQSSQETLSAIAGGNPAARLRRTPATNDRSKPLIEPGTSVRHFAAPQLFAQLLQMGRQPGGPQGIILRHTELTNDRSAPHIEPGTSVKRSPVPQLFDELKRKVSSLFGS